jgi:hypothetical protein
VFLCSSASAQSATGVLPSSRVIDWSRAGIPGGIPSRNWPIYKTLSPSGGADDSVAIQSAINAAPAGSVVLLGPGTYTLHRSSKVCYGKSDDYGGGVYEAGLCLTDKSVVLRGAGPEQTVLRYGDGGNIISLGKTYLSSSQASMVSITAGASKGSTSITVSSASGISANSYIVITQNNPTDSDGNPLVNTSGYTGSCSACGHDMAGTVMTQIDLVTNVSGNVLTLETPLYFNYTNSPKIFKLPMVEKVGLEDLRVTGTASSGSNIVYKNINLEACAHCWVHNVQSDNAVDRSHIYLSDVYGSEISNNYLVDGYNHNSGLTYSLYLEFRASQNLIQNNIIVRGRHGLIMSGGSGNVFGYNALIDDYMGEYHNSLPESFTHAAHPYMNLWEGNVAGNVEFDFAHGSSSHNTLFRNYISLINNNPDTGRPMTGALFAVNVAYYNNYINVVGNVLGPYGSACTAANYQINSGSSQGSSIYKLGFYDDGGGSSPNSALSAKVENTLLRGGNWDCKTGSVVWSSNAPSGTVASSYLASQTLPASFYLPGKPAWFGNTAWPPIDPTATVKVVKIPALLCYEAGPKVGLPFDPSVCYAGGVSSAPLPPTDLTAVVN